MRARDLGVGVGLLAPGPHNAITDVAGVTVGHTTLITDLEDGRAVRTWSGEWIWRCTGSAHLSPRSTE